ncbi:MAG: hypothetical protein M3280_08845 [Actinomycetota bacterium]|nr:hypothetical protein [Actinomycetota bacterium]
MSRRASLPGADELFRKTSPQRSETPKKGAPPVDKSTKLQVAESPKTEAPSARRTPKHEEKVTFYCTRDDLMALEKARLGLRADHGVGADRGRIVRTALSYVLEDFEARGEDSVLVRRLVD